MSKLPKLVRALAEQLRGSIEPGAAWGGEIVMEGDVDLVAEITVRVRRRVTSDAARDFRAAALEALRKDPWRVYHCGCSVKRRGWIGSHSADCSGKIVAAVAYRLLVSGDVAFLFVCNRHRDGHKIEPRRVLAAVALAPHDLQPIREEADKAKAALDAKWRAEEAAREAREAAPVPLSPIQENRT